MITKIKILLLKYWVPLFVLLVWFGFASPYFLRGKIPFPSTYLVSFFSPWNNFYGMPIKNNAMPDIITQIYPWKTISIDSWEKGQIPRWNPYQFAGNPHLANVQSAALTPINILFFFLPFNDAWALQILLQPLLAGLFMYLYLKSINVSNVGSAMGSVSFMFCGFITVWMEYGTLAYTILYLPLFFYAIERYYQKQDFISKILILVSVPLSVFSGHFQTSLYFLILGLGYILFKSLVSRNLKYPLIQTSLVLLGLIISLPQLLPSIYFYSQSVRSELFQKGEVIPWNYLPTIIAPDFFGNAVTRNDWYGHYAEWASYAGTVPFVLATFLLFFRKKRNPTIFFFIITAITSLFLAYPTPLGDFLLALHLPVLSTSSFSRIIVVFSLSVAILAAVSCDVLSEAWNRRVLSSNIFFFAFLWVVIVLAVWLMLLAGNLVFMEGVLPDKVFIAKRNFIFPSMLIFSSLVLIFLGYVRLKLFKIITLALLLALTTFEMLRFATKWIPFDPRKFIYPRLDVIAYLQKYAGTWRVFGNISNEAMAPFGLYGIEGYDPLYIRHYAEFITSATDGTLGRIERSVVNINKNGMYTKKILDLLGVRYIVQSKGDGRNIWAFPYWSYPEAIGSPVYSDDKYEIYENTTALPRAYFVNNYRIKTHKPDILRTILAESINLRDTVILEETPVGVSVEDQPPKLDTDLSRVTITKYTPNEVLMELNAPSSGLVFLSDTYYPGWSVYVNDIKSKIYRANYAFRAVAVQKGKTKIKFVYENWIL